MAKKPELDEAIQFVSDKKDAEYHDLVARSLVEMAPNIFVGLLLIRDAAADEKRAAIAERYVLDAIRDFDRNKAYVVSGDDRLITNRRDIIDY